MARVLYLDCFSGISGDMFLGACLDAGLPLDELRAALGSLALGGVTISSERALRAGVAATKFLVHEDGGVGAAEASHAHPHVPGAEQGAHRTLSEILALVDRSALGATARRKTADLFRRLADAEAAIHQMPVEQVHLHEVGAIDSIIDIVGAVFAMEWIGAERVVCSPLNVGSGTVMSAHGVLPVPAPATLRLLGNAPIYAGGIRKELVTPTGALIAASYATEFGALPLMTTKAIGYGAGLRDNPGAPNVLRILIGDDASQSKGDRIAVLECEIDDMNPQLFGVAMDRLYAAGALDVFYSAVQMKKNRPGTMLTVLAPLEKQQALVDVVFRETTTIGVRHTEMARTVLARDHVTVDTPVGAVRIKQAWHNGRVVNAAPEFDDCAALARSHNVTVKDVQAMALRAYAAPPEGSRS